MKLLFFLSLFMLFYVYLGYPALIALLSLIKNRRVEKNPFEPIVSILISAYNEQDAIETTLKNKLDLDYPNEKLEVIVISDGSTDRTDEIVKKYEGKTVRLIRQEPRAGKTSALNMVVPEAKGELLVFSDANSIWARNALEKLMMNFADPRVGYVTGKMIYTDTSGNPIGDGCSAYMKYENQLRSWETRLGSIVGVDGGIDAVRKKLYQPMTPDQLPDFVLPLKVVEQGYRVVYEPHAILKEPPLTTGQDEYKMRVRVALRALWGMWDMRHLLTFSRSPSLRLSRSILFAWQLWSHKVLRYLCFLLLVIAYFSNLALWSEGAFYKLLFIIQTMAYAGAVLSPVLEKKDIRSRLLYLLNYFALLNLASAHAFIKFLLGQKTVTWTPRKG
ncbi:MAG: glycosyltransferase family 2 protein [Thermodesulfobacteriota bacterium]